MEESFSYKLGVFAADLAITLIIVGFIFAIIYAIYYIVKGSRRK